jgi:hypothetical protein
MAVVVVDLDKARLLNRRTFGPPELFSAPARLAALTIC